MHNRGIETTRGTTHQLPTLLGGEMATECGQLLTGFSCRTVSLLSYSVCLVYSILKGKRGVRGKETIFARLVILTKIVMCSDLVNAKFNDEKKKNAFNNEKHLVFNSDILWSWELNEPPKRPLIVPMYCCSDPGILTVTL